jgi:cyclopropane fatty-acyl-phospholipid synthase-like methyltransferase
VSLTEITAKGLHNELFHYFRKNVPIESSILDCGAGEGAWAERLISEGYKNVTVTEINESRYRASADVVVADLNEDFSGLISKRPDIITAIEVIEHLENPVHFLKQCSRLLKPDGKLLLTTPNTECAPGRLKFLVQGNLRHFDRNADRTHITPILTEIFPKLANKSGFEIVEVYPLIRYWDDERMLVKIISRLVAPFLKGYVYGECNLFMLRPL